MGSQLRSSSGKDRLYSFKGSSLVLRMCTLHRLGGCLSVAVEWEGCKNVYRALPTKPCCETLGLGFRV